MGNVIYLSHRDAARSRVATEVRVEMARAGINESALATATGISQSTMNRRLKPKAERDAFTVDELERVADVLGVPIGAFFKTTTGHDGGDGGDDNAPASAPTRARTWDLRIIRESNVLQSTEIDHLPLRKSA